MVIVNVTPISSAFLTPGLLHRIDSSPFSRPALIRQLCHAHVHNIRISSIIHIFHTLPSSLFQSYLSLPQRAANSL